TIDQPQLIIDQTVRGHCSCEVRTSTGGISHNEFRPIALLSVPAPLVEVALVLVDVTVATTEGHPKRNLAHGWDCCRSAQAAVVGHPIDLDQAGALLGDQELTTIRRKLHLRRIR